MNDQWFFAADNTQKGPVSRDVLRGMLEASQLPADAPVWTEGMTAWQPANTVDGLLGAPLAVATAVPAATIGYAGLGAPTQSMFVTERMITSLGQTGPWARFVAIMAFIFAGLCIIGGLFIAMFALGSGTTAGVLMLLVYVVIGLLYLLPGLLLNRFASQVGALKRVRREDVLESALESQRKLWRLIGLMIITVIALYFVGIAIAVIAAMVS
jgi:hypothetical protein